MSVPFYVHACMSDQTPDSTNPKPALIAIVGPTAVGKTRISLDLAERLDGEIINADSRSFYRGMDIGTAKVSPEDQRRVRHHLVDFLEPGDNVSLALFQDLVTDRVQDIASRGRVPFLVGGTPQYVNAVIEGWQIPRVEPDPEFRSRLQHEIDTIGFEPVLQRLRDVDPDSAERTGPNIRRIIRALEVYEKTGIPMSKQQGKGPPPYNTLELELWRPREELYQRIDDRVQKQVDAGLMDEIRALLDAGVSPDAPAFSSIGYRQAMPYIRGEASLEDVMERIRFDTHRLVRHQETWWRKNPRLIRIDMTRTGAFDHAMRLVESHLAESDLLNP